MNVTADLKAIYLAADGAKRTVPVRLVWSRRDPFAVQLFVNPQSPAPVCWRFAWDLLAEGLHGMAGIGNVRVAPSAANPGKTAVMLISGGTVGALLFSTAELDGFLADTWLAEPPPIPDFVHAMFPDCADEGAAS